MSVLFTFPGKIGDTFHQWPLAYHWSKEQQKKIVVGLEATMLGPLVNLFRSQPCVEDVILLYGIQHWMIGGQPWDFGFEEKDYAKWESVHHMGFRSMPNKQLTLFQQNVIEVAASFEQLSCEPSIAPRHEGQKDLCVLHGTESSKRFWKMLEECGDLLRYAFKEIVFVGSRKDLDLIESRGLDKFDDQGDFMRLAAFIKDAALVIGCGSSVVALAGAMKIPSVRVPEREISQDIWSNLGPKQWNLSPGSYRDRILEIVERTSWKPLAK